MSREQLKPKDKVVMRMTRDGAVEDNLTEGTSERISKRLEDAQLVKPHEADSSILPEEAAKHKQPIPEDLLPKQDEQPPDEAPTEQVKSEYKPGELPVDPSHGKTHRDYLSIFSCGSWNSAPRSTDSGKFPSPHRPGRIRDPAPARWK